MSLLLNGRGMPKEWKFKVGDDIRHLTHEGFFGKVIGYSMGEYRIKWDRLQPLKDTKYHIELNYVKVTPLERLL